jgi:hypothetical protein
VQHLVHVGTHSGALPGGEDHDCEIGGLAHPRPNGTRIFQAPEGASVPKIARPQSADTIRAAHSRTALGTVKATTAA